MIYEGWYEDEETVRFVSYPEKFIESNGYIIDVMDGEPILKLSYELEERLE